MELLRRERDLVALAERPERLCRLCCLELTPFCVLELRVLLTAPRPAVTSVALAGVGVRSAFVCRDGHIAATAALSRVVVVRKTIVEVASVPDGVVLDPARGSPRVHVHKLGHFSHKNLAMSVFCMQHNFQIVCEFLSENRRKIE